MRATSNTETQTEIRSYLEPGENLLWDGYGDGPKGPMILALLIFLCFCLSPIPIFFFYYYVFYPEFYAIRFHPTPTAVLFAVAFGFAAVCIGVFSIGLYGVINALLDLKSWPKHVTYGLTDRRALILRRRKVISRFLQEVVEIGLEDQRDGAGTIRFGKDRYTTERYTDSQGHRASRTVTIYAPRFLRIANATAVYQLAQKAKADLEGVKRVMADAPVRCDVSV